MLRARADLLAFAIGGGLLASVALADSPLARLAESAADEIVRTAKGAAVELPATEDRTGRGLALDLNALILARLKGRLAIVNSGPRLRIASVVSETPARLSFSARVIEEPGATLVDLLSVSIPAAGADLSFVPQRPSLPSGASLEIASSNRTPALTATVLDLAFLGPDRLLILSPDEVTLYRWTSEGLVLLSRRPLPGPYAPVRTPGGILVTAPKEDSFWAMTSRAAHAVLIAVQGAGLIERQQADAVPWPGAALGLRYRPGTNLIEGALTGLGPGPFLDLDSAEGGLAVTADGRLRCLGCRDQRVGLGIAGLWRGFLVASSPAPPGADDALLIFEHSEAGLETPLRLPVDGAVRALTSRVDGRSVRLVAAVAPTTGGSYLLTLDLVRP